MMGTTTILGRTYQTVVLPNETEWIKGHLLNSSGGDVIVTWDAAMSLVSSISGWRMPSQSDFGSLISSVGGTSVAGAKPVSGSTVEGVL